MDLKTAVNAKLHRSNLWTGAVTAAVAVGMLGAAYAAVPLYRMFCQATGYEGTTQRVTKAADVVLDHTMSVRFDANVRNLPWDFQPAVPRIDVRVGETVQAIYRATNRSDHAVTGSAIFNVSPEIMGSYFNKLECFCFTEQTLQPGQTVDMPVVFYIDPAIMKDKGGRGVAEVTLSYTFHPVDTPRRAAEAAKPGGRG